MQSVEKILKEFEGEIVSARISDIESLRHRFLGRKSELNEILKSVGSLSIEEKKTVGRVANLARKSIEEAIAEKEKELSGKSSVEEIDITAPGRLYEVGHIHPATKVTAEILEVFKSLGYEIVEGPEVEDDWHNFEALNMPENHPARDMQDTFYLENGTLPRTHTSSVQIRYMENHKPPIKIVSAGKVHRNENEDATHSWVFHQIEGLVVDKGITFADLKGTLEYMAKAILGEDTKTRLRPSFFPYTEPSAELDASCPHCKGEGCRSCGGSGWLELLGSGMVHPDVLDKMGIDSSVYTGFAFGLGPERIAAIKYQIPDIRYYWHPDVRFLEQF